MKYWIMTLLMLILVLCNACATGADRIVTNAIQSTGDECVVLLHGLARTSHSMDRLADELTKAGYRVINMDYPSRKFEIPSLSRMVMPQALAECAELNPPRQIHFVTHSLGGILLRYHLSQEPIPGLGRVVMLSPPNQGSEVVDRLKNFPGFRLWNGPAGQQLGTDDASIPLQLGPVNYDVGVITGDRSINLFLSMLIPGKDDGKVSTTRARVEGMHDYLILPVAHPFIMTDRRVMAQVIHYLSHGQFYRTDAVTDTDN